MFSSSAPNFFPFFFMFEVIISMAELTKVITSFTQKLFQNNLRSVAETEMVVFFISTVNNRYCQDFFAPCYQETVGGICA